MTKKAEKGNIVKIHYTGTFENGEVFDSSEQCMSDHHDHDHGDHHHHHDHGPLEFELGSGQVIKGFDDAIIGMSVEETKKVTIAPEDAYGLPREDMIVVFKTNQFPEGMTPEPGLMIELNNDQGGVIPATITKVEGEDVTIDANHPLAGKTLIFDLRLVEIV